MLHARRQSTAELQQQHVDRLNRHTIHTTSAGIAHANGPTARATVNSTSWWWGQEQRVVLNFVDADTTQKAMGATSAQIDFVCVICTSNSSTAAVASLPLPLSLYVSLFKGTSQRHRHSSTCPFIVSQLQRSVCTNGEDAVVVPNPRACSRGKRSQRQLWDPGEWGKDFPQNSFLYDRILERPPVVDRYSAKKMS